MWHPKTNKFHEIHDNTDEQSAVHGAEDSLAPPLGGQAPLGVAFVNTTDVGRHTGSLGTSRTSRPIEGKHNDEENSFVKGCKSVFLKLGLIWSDII